MAPEAKKNMQELQDNRMKYAVVVTQRISKERSPKNAAVIASAAKYFDAILKLAQS